MYIHVSEWSLLFGNFKRILEKKNFSMKFFWLDLGIITSNKLLTV